jgi:hypothetical protein
VSCPAQITEEGADTQLDTDRNLSNISTQKEKLRKRLAQLNKSLDEIHAEETDIVGDDMSELVQELGGDAWNDDDVESLQCGDGGESNQMQQALTLFKTKSGFSEPSALNRIS